MSFIKWKFIAALCMFVVLWTAGTACGQDESAAVNIPRLDNIKIDGKADDWGDGGYRVEMAVFDATDMPTAADFDPKFRLAWNDEGLLIFAEVDDDKACEDEDQRFLYRKDSVTLFIAEALGSANVYNTILASGADAARGGKLRMDFCDRRPAGAKHPELTAKAASVVTKTGYAIEILLPWNNLELKPGEGGTVAFQIQFTDNDGEMDTPAPARWYPVLGAADDTRKMYVLKLADKADPPCVATATGSYEKLRRAKVCVVAAGSMKGKGVTVTHGKTNLAVGTLSDVDGRATAEILFPMPKLGETYDRLQVVIDGQPPMEIRMPDARELRAKQVMKSKIAFDSFIFTGTMFPKCDFSRPAEMEDAIGR